MECEEAAGAETWGETVDNSAPEVDVVSELKGLVEGLAASFTEKVDAMNRKYDDLRHTLTREVPDGDVDEPQDWSWEALRETMFPRAI